MPAAVELPRDELNFGGNPFSIKKRKMYHLHKLG